MSYNVLYLTDIKEGEEIFEEESYSFTDDLEVLENINSLPIVPDNLYNTNTYYTFYIDEYVKNEEIKISQYLYHTICNINKIVINIPFNKKRSLVSDKKIIQPTANLITKLLTIINDVEIIFDNVQSDYLYEELICEFIKTTKDIGKVINKLTIPASVLFNKNFDIELFESLIDDKKILSLNIFDCYVKQSTRLFRLFEIKKSFKKGEVYEQYMELFDKVIEFLDTYQNKISITLQSKTLIDIESLNEMVYESCLLNNYLYHNIVEDSEEIYKSLTASSVNKTLNIVCHTDFYLQLLQAPSILNKSNVYFQTEISKLPHIQSNIYVDMYNLLSNLLSDIKYIDGQTINQNITTYLSNLISNNILGFIIYTTPTEVETNNGIVTIKEIGSDQKIILNEFAGICLTVLVNPFKYLDKIDSSINIITTNHI